MVLAKKYIFKSLLFLAVLLIPFSGFFTKSAEAITVKTCSRSASDGVSILASTLQTACADKCNSMGYTSALGYISEHVCKYSGTGLVGWNSNITFSFDTCVYANNISQSVPDYNLCWFGSNSPDPEIIDCNCVLSSCDPNIGNPCNRNACGGTGTILCDGTCSVPAPTLYGTAACITSANVCMAQGVTGNAACAAQGLSCLSSNCFGGCSDYPAAPGPCGCTAVCGSGAPSCGTGNTNNCTGACDSPAPPAPSYTVGDACNRNVCGGSGTIIDACTGACSSPAPVIPVDYGTACNRNTCGGTGTILCDGSCSAPAPPCDITPPIVDGFYSPSSPISNTQTVSFTGNASDISGINLISLYIDGGLVKDCISLTSCFYIGGPYSLGTHTFRVFSVDNSAQSNNNYSLVYNFIVEDTVPPNVNGSYLPANPNTEQSIFFTGNALDPSGINLTSLYVDGVLVNDCPLATSCSYVGASESYLPGIHTFTVDAWDKNNNLSSVSYNFTVTLANTAPSQVTGLSAIANDSQVTLNWSAPADGGSLITNYRVYRNTVSGSPVSLTVLDNVTTYTNTGLANDQNYYYSVSAVNAVGEGLKSSEVNTFFADTILPVVSGTFSSDIPWSNQTVSFAGRAADASGIATIGIYVDGVLAKTCDSAIYCPYIGGPYSVGNHTYVVEAYDNSSNFNYNSAVYVFAVILEKESVEVDSDSEIQEADNSLEEVKRTEKAKKPDKTLSVDKSLAGSWKVELEMEPAYDICKDPADNAPVESTVELWLDNVRYGTIKSQNGVINSGNYEYVSFDFDTSTVDSGTKFDVYVYQVDSGDGCSANTKIKNYRIIFDYCASDNTGTECNRNVCGGTGVIQCDGTCSDPEPTIFGIAPCDINACGSGTTDNCTGACDSPAPPVVPVDYGNPCNRNDSCSGVGEGTGVIQCDGNCSDVAPALFGTEICDANACFVANKNNCTGACDSPALLAVPANYNDVCESVPNNCGQTISGNILCDGLCSAITPTDDSCDYLLDWVNGSHSPDSPTNPTTLQDVIFTGNAGDVSGIKYIEIVVDGVSVNVCEDVETCTYTGGPYSAGLHSYFIIAYDNYGNWDVALYTFDVSIPLNNPPTVSELEIVPVNYCEKDLGEIRFNWTFEDDEDVEQKAFQLDINTGGPICSTGKITSANTSVLVSYIEGFGGDCLGMVRYNQNVYNWKVTVWDSDTSSFATTITDLNDSLNPIPNHKPPLADFTAPVEALIFDIINFDPFSSSVDIGYLIANWTWDFGDGSAQVSIDNLPTIDGKVTYSYSEVDSYTINLMVTDNSPQAYSCWASDRGNQKVINISDNKPKWNETTPTQ